MNKIFITGTDGFIGKHLTAQLLTKNISFVAGNRAIYGDLTRQNHWDTVLANCDCVIHLAARVHVMQETSSNALAEFRLNNVQPTIKMALAAKKLGIKRFIFLSSVKVNGEETINTPFTPDDLPNPQDAYGISKYEAEIELLKLHEPGVFEG